MDLFARLTSAFSKKIGNPTHMVALYINRLLQLYSAACIGFPRNGSGYQ
jgi:hypothetical protein